MINLYALFCVLCLVGTFCSMIFIEEADAKVLSLSFAGGFIVFLLMTVIEFLVQIKALLESFQCSIF